MLAGMGICLSGSPCRYRNPNERICPNKPQPNKAGQVSPVFLQIAGMNVQTRSNVFQMEWICFLQKIISWKLEVM